MLAFKLAHDSITGFAPGLAYSHVSKGNSMSPMGAVSRLVGWAASRIIKSAPASIRLLSHSRNGDRLALGFGLEPGLIAIGCRFVSGDAKWRMRKSSITLSFSIGPLWYQVLPVGGQQLSRCSSKSNGRCHDDTKMGTATSCPISLSHTSDVPKTPIEPPCYTVCEKLRDLRLTTCLM